MLSVPPDVICHERKQRKTATDMDVAGEENSKRDAAIASLYRNAAEDNSGFQGQQKPLNS